MTEAPLDIDRIVREVIAELGRLAAPDSPAAAPQQRPSSTVPKQPLASDDAANGDLVLDCRLVTIAEVEGQLEATRRLVVPRGAVVTPSVYDELYRRRVALVYATASVPRASGGLRLVLMTLGKRFDPATLLGALGKDGLDVDRQTSDCLIDATDRLAEQIAPGDTLGLLLTRHNAAAVCLANRHNAVRAIGAGDVRTVAADAASVGANLLVVDPAVAGLFQLKQIVAEFCRGGVRPCPAVYEERLDRAATGEGE